MGSDGGRSGRIGTLMRPGRSGDPDRRAKLWDEGVAAQWEMRLAPALLDALKLPSDGSVLAAECRTGTVPIMLADRLSDNVRCIAIDSNREMLDLARGKVFSGKRRLWWESRNVEKLPYQAGVFGTCLCTAGILTKDDLHRIGSQLVRVTQPGGTLGLIVPLQGSFSAFYDLFREALLALDLRVFEAALDVFIDDLFDEETLKIDLAAAGVRDVEVNVVSFDLPLTSGKAFFEAPLVEAMFRPYWRQICSDAAAWVRIVRYIEQALDTYFLGFQMTTTVRAAWILGRRP
jgi:ubiquinone/menaquinone biosynthesis C-methylase UbiE